MFISYPHARFLSTFEGNKLNRGYLRRQSTQGWCHLAASSTGVAPSAGQVDTWTPSLRRLTPQVVVQAGRPHCHLSGPAAQERVTTTSKGAHANIPRPAHRITELMYRRCPHEEASRCHHLLYRLPRTRKPKSHATSNTQCPTTRRWQYRRAAHTATNSRVGRSAPITTGDFGYEKSTPAGVPFQKCRTPTGGSHRGGPLRARRDSNPQPSEP